MIPDKEELERLKRYLPYILVLFLMLENRRIQEARVLEQKEQTAIFKEGYFLSAQTFLEYAKQKSSISPDTGIYTGGAARDTSWRAVE